MRQAFFVTFLTGALAAASVADAQTPTPPPAPALVEPAAGASRFQPIALRWNPVVDPDGPIGSYTWQVATSSSFTTIVLSGFTQESLPGIPVPTQDKVSGLPLGTYFWRVRASQTIGGAIGSIDSPWSTVRTFTVSALVAEPGTPSFTSPGNGARFHALEFFPITWSAVDDAQYYMLEADDEPSFSYPLTLNTDVMHFATTFRAGWGNEIPNIYYRVRAVSADGVRGLPSPTLNVKITNTAPVPPAPAPLAPNGGATVSIPFTFDWTDTSNPQDAGYDLDIDDEPGFQGAFGVFLVQNVSRSDYMLTETLAPGTYFWRVRAVHGAVRGPWSTGGSFRIVAGPSPGVTILSLVAAPITAYGGNPTQARVTINTPAPAGGVVVKVASDFSQAQTPFSVTIPAGKTDATIFPITSVPVPADAVGTIRAAIAGSWQQSSLGVSPLLFGLELSDESVIGGDALTGTVTLLNPAPPGGVDVTLVNGDTSLLTLPAKVSIPAGAFGATFNIATLPVSVPTRVIVDSGTAFERHRAPSNWLTLMPVVSPAPAPSLSAVTVATSSVPSGGKTTGTVTLTGPAPSGGALVRLNGSMEGTVITPPNVTVPAGSVSANFPITAPQVFAPHYVLIQASYSSFGVSHARLIEIAPGSSSPTLLALGVSPTSVVGGASTTGTVQLVVPAPAGGGIVALTSDNPALVQVPASVSVPAGNSATSFTINTSAVTSFTTVRIDATAGGVTRSEFINLAASPNPPAGLQAVTLGASSVTGGATVTGAVVLTGNAPAGGVSVTLATSNPSAAQVPPVVTVPAGQSQVNFSVTTFAVSTNTVVTITGFQGTVTLSVGLTVLSGSSVPTPGTPTLVSPADTAAVNQPVTLDWNNASNAASYEIQVDDSSSFSAPLVSSLTSTASQTSVSGLAAVQYWWRVRAKNSAGVAGNWSASRRFTVNSGSPSALAIALSGVPATISRGQSFNATATVNNTGGAAASGLSVVVSFTPGDALRLRSPQGATQSVATVSAGGSRTVAWEIRAERSGTATLTMTLRNSSGTTVGTATRTLTIN
jgi:hypothetical protein